MSIRITLGTFFFDVKFRILHSYCRIINNGKWCTYPLCWEANDTWSGQCQSCVKTTTSNCDLIEFITGMTSSPLGTAKLPPFKKQFWTSIINNAEVLALPKDILYTNKADKNKQTWLIRLMFDKGIV